MERATPPRTRWSLATQVVVRLLLNLIVVGAAFAGALVLQVRLNPTWLLAGQAGERLRSIAEMMSTDLGLAGAGNESAVAEQYEQAYHLEFRLFEPAGRELTSRTNLVPPVVHQEIVRPRQPGPGRDRLQARRLSNPADAPPPSVSPDPPQPNEETETAGAPRDGRIPGRRVAPRRDGALDGPPYGPGRRAAAQRLAARDALNPRVLVRAGQPPAYWIVTPLPPHGNAPGLILVVRAPSLWSGGLLLEPRPWIFAGAGALALSVLFWLPFVRSITRDVARLTRQTETIAGGRFETRLELERNDELGRLSDAIDQMAARLAHHVAGQKRFLGDAAHELSGPIARMQAAVAILETRVPPDQAAYLGDLREELEEMGGLVAELLTFSRAAHGRTVRLAPVAVGPTLDRAWAREGVGTVVFTQAVTTEVVVLADAALLQRLFANLLRNAVRYAGAHGPLRAEARAREDQWEIAILDEGPGVPPEALPRLFEPFFRPEDARTKETGGAGLGLAIVKTCVDACQGTVSARNRSPRGFEVVVRLRRANPTADPG